MIFPSVWGEAEVGSLQFLLRQYDSVERLCSAMCYLNVIRFNTIIQSSRGPLRCSPSSLSALRSACSLSLST